MDKVSWQVKYILPSKGVCVCVFVLRPLLFPSRRGRMRALSSAYNTDRAEITDWMPFLPTNLMAGISPNTEALSTNT